MLERAALSAILWATTCMSCAQPRLVPMVLRPDTRNVWAVTIDSAAVAQTMTILTAAMPNEAAVCYRGELRDTVFTHGEPIGRHGLLLLLTSATVAAQDSADQFHVFGPACATEIIAIGHSHPYALDRCDHSLPDVYLLFGIPRALVSIVWCANGEKQILYQDGTRTTERWRDQ